MSQPTADDAALVGFGRALRADGVIVGTGQLVTFVRSVRTLEATTEDVYWAGRAALGVTPDAVDVYDRVFADWFRDARQNTVTVAGVSPRAVAVPGAREPAQSTTSPPPQEPPRDGAGRVASSAEALRDKDFAHCTPAELLVVRRLVAELATTAPRRPSRRTQPARSGRRPDLRPLLRDVAIDPLRPSRVSWRRRRVRPRSRVLILDISGSMAAYSRILLQFGIATARAGAGARAPVEVFCFGTRLTRLTPTLRYRDPDAAIDAATAAVVDWDGGTRIGESLRAYLCNHGHRATCRGAVVVICSDGLERGDPELLAAQLARLRRLSHRVVWVNPLAGGSEFEPTTRGMQAALPYVDVLISGHSLGSLEELSRVVSKLV